MANMQKCKRTAVGNMLHHYKRDRSAVLERENIDPSRTHLNYTVGDGRDPAAVIRAAIEEHNANGRALRSDAVVVADWVVTAPRDLDPTDERRFFGSCHDFISRRYGAENVPTGYVHMDEVGHRSHLHQPVIPLTDAGRLQASKMLDRQDLRTFHKALSEHVERDLGYRVSIELPEQERGRKQLSHLSQEDYKAAQDEIARAQHVRDGLRAENAELRRDNAELEQRKDEIEPQVEQLEQRQAEVAGQVNDLWHQHEDLCTEIEEEQRRLESVRQARAGADERVADLERQVAERRAEVAHERTSVARGGLGRRIARSAGDGIRGALGGNRELGERERAARERHRELEAQKGQLDAEIGELERSITESQALLGRIGARIKELEQGVSELRDELRERVARAVERLKSWYMEQTRGIGRDDFGRGYDPPDRTLDR